MAAAELEENTPEEQLAYVEPITGLFHYGWAVLSLIFRSHERRNDEFGSLVYWMNWIKRRTNMWDPTKGRVVDFGKCNSFFNHLTDAHLLAAVAVELGVDIGELAEDNRGGFKTCQQSWVGIWLEAGDERNEGCCS